MKKDFYEPRVAKELMKAAYSDVGFMVQKNAKASLPGWKGLGLWQREMAVHYISFMEQGAIAVKQTWRWL